MEKSMVDLYLQAMMNGQLNVKKDKFDEAIEKDIKLYVDSLPIEEEAANSSPQLVSPRMKRAKLVEEIKEQIKMTELGDYIKNAFAFLKSDGLHFLETPVYETLNAEFQEGVKALNDFDPNAHIDENFQKIIGVSDDSMEAIYHVATRAYKEERYSDCLSLFVLLVTLNQTNSEYWFRLGIAAQKEKNLDLALKAYAISISMDSELIGARLFSAECYLTQKNIEDAVEEINEAKKIKELTDVETNWLNLLASIEEGIKVRTVK